MTLLPASPTITPAPGPLLRRHDSLWLSSESSESSRSLASIWSISCISTLSTHSLSSVASKQSLSHSALSSALPSAVTSSVNNVTTTQPSATTVMVSTNVPATIYLSSTTIVTSTVSLITATISSPASIITTPNPTSTSPFNPSVSQAMDNSSQGVTCAGNGLDTNGEGVLATAVITALLGLLIWLIFALVRPRLPQMYAVREWFVNPQVRPEHLGSGLFAFLHPPVPFKPSLTNDNPQTGNPVMDAAQAFPSDEQLSQRTLYVAFLITLGWTFLGLAVILPIYLVSTPCLATSTPALTEGTAYSTLSDLSLMRLLKLVDNNDLTTVGANHQRRAIINGVNEYNTARARLIAVTVLLILLGVLPALRKILKEFNSLVAYRQRWLAVRCGGLEMGWLSLIEAPGLTGWSESRMKDYLTKNGLGRSLDHRRSKPARRGWFNREPSYSGQNSQDQAAEEERAEPSIDVQGVFTVPDTRRLSELISERDRVLNDLEEAEAEYIHSFQMRAPSSIGNISGGQSGGIELSATISGQKTSRYVHRQPAFLGASSDDRAGTPTSYLAPKSYYNLSNPAKGIGGSLTMDTSFDRPRDDGDDHGTTLSQSIRRGVIGSKFQEVSHDNAQHGALPAGVLVRMDSKGRYVPTRVDRGPNTTSPEEVTDEFGQLVDHAHPDQNDSQQPWPESADGTDSGLGGSAVVVEVPHDPSFPHPGHDPGVQPLSGYDESLPRAYNSISVSRTRLKALNAEINDLQQETFNDIADGTRIKGWIMLGRGIRHIPGMQMIEGRSREDVRWNELQAGAGRLSTFWWWILVSLVGVCLGASFVFVVGLAYAGAPNFARELPFLRPLDASDNHNLVVTLATTLAPAVAGTIFIAFALWFIHHSSRFTGKPSVATTRLAEFEAIFTVLVVICGVLLVVIGGILFATSALANGSAQGTTVAEGAVYIAILMMLIMFNLAIIAPGLLLLKPVRLWKLIRQQRKSITPRQNFRAIYPGSYSPSMAMAACVLGIVFACTFSVIFPLIGPPVVVLLILTLVAHRYLVGYVHGRVGVGQTGGLLHLWVMRRFGTLLALQPFLLGLVLFSRRFWALGGILIGTAVLIVVTVEGYTAHKTRTPGRQSLDVATKDSLDRFQRLSRGRTRPSKDEEGANLVTSVSLGRRRTRRSISSMLDMMSAILAVPTENLQRGPIPLDTEHIDDMVSTERAARTKPGAPPQITFKDRSEETAGLMYPPELLAPTPVIWLPNDPNGVGRAEAENLQKYHGLQVTLDIAEDPRSSTESHRARRSTTE
ncbi:hypothetical protein FRB94_004304 [Tulasnella sp. JGI-2019a]|nr:hypothetical protein FRB94_004304 [Tulasnella sp. JGI-2019a]